MVAGLGFKELDFGVYKSAKIHFDHVNGIEMVSRYIQLIN